MKVVASAATDLGRKREQNEDCHALWIPDASQELVNRGVLFLVADGMGGSRAGEVASRIATETVVRTYREDAFDAPQDALRNAIEQANVAVHRESLTHPEHGGMGTTCTVLVIRGHDAFLGHVGDSRAYLVRNGDIRQLTQDHSLVAQLVRDNQITEEQARVDPRRNVVTRSVGVAEHVEVDAKHIAGVLQAGDTLVLCTDGLHGVVEDHEIARIASNGNLDSGCRALIDLANERGGPDNVTVILARLEDARSAVSAAEGNGR
jgi:protein phosphatase